MENDPIQIHYEIIDYYVRLVLERLKKNEECPEKYLPILYSVQPLLTKNAFFHYASNAYKKLIDHSSFRASMDTKPADSNDSDYVTVRRRYHKYQEDLTSDKKKAASSSQIEIENYSKPAGLKKGDVLRKQKREYFSLIDKQEIEYQDRYRIFNAVRNKRASSIKKLSNKEFSDLFFPEIKSRNDGLYKDLIVSEKEDATTILINTIHLFNIEFNCRFELCYQIAKLIFPLPKKEREEARNIYSENCFGTQIETDLGFFVLKNPIILGVDKLLNCNLNNSSSDICQLFADSNAIVRNALLLFRATNPETTLEDFNESTFMKDFCLNYIGKGQHISEKRLDEIRLTDFRLLFAE